MVGQKITIFSISSMMAHTMARRWNVKQIQEAEIVKSGYDEWVWRLGGGTDKPRARKRYWIDLDPRNQLMFDGHDIPIYTDSENPGRRDPSTGFSVSGFTGNACFNLAWRGIPPRDEIMEDWEEQIVECRKWIEKNCLNWEHVTKDTKSTILFIPLGSRPDEPGNGVPLFPEEDAHNHGPADRAHKKHKAAGELIVQGITG